ncbi:MAG TPA: lysylphosphatidylglycerol synthase domain-containing protein [Ilumatobacteraceae bacterium]|nr:lysylphosphatidylglycerol synthase domain-containing protein [Ilumatobacteraceae bacterium]
MSTPRSEADSAHPPIKLSDLGSGRLTTRAFAVPSDPQRFRRPTDVVLLVLSLVILTVTASAVDDPGDFERSFADWLTNLPGLLDLFWKIAYDFVQIWVLVVGVLALARRRWGLLRDWAASIAIATGGVVLIGRLVDGEVPALTDSIGAADGAAAFPSLALAAGAATVAVASPYFVSPLRTFGRWLIGTAWLASLVIGVTQPGAGLCALAIGWAAGALVHLVFGSPDGTMTLHDLGAALRSIGVDAQPTKVDVRNGVIVARARTPDDRLLDVHVHGRDSWDSQFFVKMWRLIFYRSGGRNVTVNRRHQIEHQAYLTLYAQREGALVTPLVAAAMDQRSNALFVVERVGPAFGADDAQVDGAEVEDELLASAWTSLARLHDAGICHGGITPGHLQVADGGIYFGEFDRASIDWNETSRRLDEAQLLTSTAVVVDAERAIAAAVAALGAKRLAATTTFVQPAAMLPALRRQADDADVDIDDLRKATITAVGAEEQDLQAIRRFSVGNVLMWVLLGIVFYTIVGAIQQVGLQSIIDEVAGASVPILILALIVGQTPRFAGAFSVSQAAPIPVPYGRLTLLEFAITFVNLAVPSTAARVAVNIRFFQRNGLDRTMAIAVSGLDSVSGFVAQITLLVVIIGFGLGSLNLNISASAPDFNWSLVLIAVAILVVALAVVAFTPKFRDPVVNVLKTTWGKVGPLLTSPRRLISVVLANLLVQLLFSLTSYTILVAFGQDVGFADVVLVNVCVALFSGLMPVPGGVGVTVAALTAGYTAIGVDSASAMGAAMCYRIITFYIPPCFGYFAMKSLRRQRVL